MTPADSDPGWTQQAGLRLPPDALLGLARRRTRPDGVAKINSHPQVKGYSYVNLNLGTLPTDGARVKHATPTG